MTNYKEKFQEKIKDCFVKGHQHNNLAKIANNAVYYEIDFNDALSIIKENWIGDFTKGDALSFKNAYNESKTKITETASDKKEKKISKKEQLKQISEQINNQKNSSQIELNIELLKRKIENAELKSNNVILTKTTADLLYWFDLSDKIWISKGVNIDTPIRDVENDFICKTKNLSIYSYMCINSFKENADKRNDASISKFRYILLESDNLELKYQKKLWIDMINFGVPIKSVIFSGGKSYHTLIKIKNINSVEEYKEYCEKLFNLFSQYIGQSIDEANKNPSRLSRSPFGTYDKPGENEGNCQEVIYVDTSFEVKEDAYTKIKEYFDKIGLIVKLKEIKRDIINENELLFYVDRSVIFDIWGDSNYFYWRIKDFTNRNLYKQEKFTSRARLNECCLQYIDKAYKKTLKDSSDLQELIIKYKQIVFQPCLKKDLNVNENLVNEFKPGYLSDILNDKEIPSQLNDKLKTFIDNIFGNNTDAKNWVFQWMRHFMHNFNKMLTAPVFWDKPGIGKSMIAEAFGNCIGNWIAPKQTQIEDVRFNSWVKNAVIILDECAAGNKKDGKAFGDYLKSLITQPNQTIEHKGKDIIDILIPNCFIFTANSDSYTPPVYLEENDRRYTIIHNEKSRNLQELWTQEEFINYWNNGSGLWAKILMKYIYNLPEDKSININYGLTSEYKEKILGMSKNNIQIIAEQFYNDHVNQGFISNDMIKDELKNNYVFDYSLSFKKILLDLGCEEKSKRITGLDGFSKIFRGLIF